MQESGRNEWYDLGNQGKLRRPSTLQSCSAKPSSAKEEDHGELREERRRRRIAFENLAKSMLGYLNNCKEVKVGITELQER